MVKKVVLHPKDSAVPKAFKARLVPFSLRKPVEQELNRMEAQVIRERVDPAITPIEYDDTDNIPRELQ